MLWATCSLEGHRVCRVTTGSGSAFITAAASAFIAGLILHFHIRTHYRLPPRALLNQELDTQ